MKSPSLISLWSCGFDYNSQYFVSKLKQLMSIKKVVIVSICIFVCTNACSHIPDNRTSLESRLCTEPEKVADGRYITQFDLVSTSHGSAVYFAECPDEWIDADLSVAMPRDQLTSKFAQAVYRNAEDPSTVLRVKGEVEYKFVRNSDIVGGEIKILRMDSWFKAKTLSSIGRPPNW